MAAQNYPKAGNTTWPVGRYDMGFAVNGSPLPDPTAYSGKESDLDTMGERDATGYLHRNMVATKYPLKMEYSNIPWEQLMEISKLLKADKFNFTFPSPFTGDLQTIEAYVGDRDFEAVWAPTNGGWRANLSFSVIQY